MPIAYVGLGSNLGDRRAHLRAAVEGLHTADGIRVCAVSPVYESEAHTLRSNEEQPPFMNAVVEAEVDCSPLELLRTAKALERKEGRDLNEARWAPRPLDVDILVVGDTVLDTEALTIPHPRLGDRRFVLQPWADLAPNFKVPPPFDASVQRLLEGCDDEADLRRTDAPLAGAFPRGHRSES